MNSIEINGETYVRADLVNAPIGPEVIIRTYSAGVHIGSIISREGKEVKLANARRLWSWKGAFTLNAVAARGVDRSNSRISIPVTEITLLEAIEIIPVTADVDLTATEKW